MATPTPTPTPVPGSGLYPWYVVSVLSAAYFVAMVDRYLMSIVLAPIKQQLALSDTQLALVHTVGFIILYTVATIPLGRMADLFSRRLLIMAGAVLWSAATIGCAFANSFPILLAARIGVGIGQAVLIPAGLSLITAYFAKRSLGRATAVFTAGAVLGGGVSLLAGGYAISYFTAIGGLHLPMLGSFRPWQSLFLLGGLPGFVIALVMTSVREPARDAELGHVRLGEVFPYFAARGRAYAALAGPFVASYMLQALVPIWSVLILTRSHGASLGDAAIWVGSVFLTIGIIGNLGGGVVLDRLNALGVVDAEQWVIGGGLGLCLPAALVFCLSPSVAGALVGLALFQLATLGAGPAAYAGIQAMTPEAYRGLAASIVLGASSLIALGVGPVLVGLISDHLFPGTGGLADSFLLVSFVVACSGLAFAWTMRRYRAAAIEPA